MSEGKNKITMALVIGQLPTIEEIDQFRLLADEYELTVFTSAAIASFINENSRFDGLACVGLPDYEENRQYLPGLEAALAGFAVVIVKDRLGIYAFQAVKAKWRHRFRLLAWIDNAQAFAGDNDNNARTVRRELANATDLYLTSSPAVAEALRLEGIADAKIAVIRPWVDAVPVAEGMDRRRYREAMQLAEGAFAIAHVGRIEWEEGLADLAAAVKIACERSPSFARRVKLIFCGIGSYAPQLRDMLVAMGCDDRAIYLAPTRQSLEHVLHGADVLFLGRTPTPERVDADPYPCLRAMAHRVPVLAHRSPLTDELCGKHRFDYTQGSAASLAKALLKAVDDASLRAGIAQRAHEEAATRFTADKARDSMRDALARAFGASGHSPDASSLDAMILDVETKIGTKQYLAAIDTIDAIFRLDHVPVHHKANLFRLVGDCFAKLGDNEGAKDAYLQAIETDPYSPKAYIGLGTVALVKKSHNVAVIHFQKAIALAPQDEMANLGLGLAFQGMGEANEAARWVIQSLDINPDNTVALFTLVKMAHESGQLAAAESALRRYVRRHPNDLNLTFALGGILFKLGKHEDVIPLMQAILEKDPMDARASGLLKEALATQATLGASSSNG